MNVLRTVFRQLAARGVLTGRGDGGAISEVAGEPLVPRLTAEDVLRLKHLGRAGGRRHRREAAQTETPQTETPRPIPVICGRRRTAAGETQPRSRHLLEIPRLTLRRTRGAHEPTESDSGATSARQRVVTDRARPSTDSSRGIRIGHVNAQSLVPKVDIINNLLETERFDLLCVSETWLTPATLSRFMVFPGYAMVRRDRASSAPGQRVRGGGVAILHRDSIQCQVLQTPETRLLETLWLSVTWRGGRPAVVGVVYRPPAGSVCQAVEELQEQLREVLLRDRPVFLLGDININVLNAQSVDAKRYQAALAELNMTQLIDRPTHPLPTPAALDHVVTNVKIPTARAEVIETDVSDHLPIAISAPIGRLRKQPMERTTRNWRRVDWDAVSLDLLLSDWTFLDTDGDINTMVEKLTATWWEVIDRHCPARTRRYRRDGCPWIVDDPDLREAMAERDAAYRAWLDLRTPESRADFCRLRNSVKGQLARARREFLGRQLLTSDRRQFWSSLKRFFMTPDSASPAPAPSQGELQARADSFNDFFASVGSKIADDLKDDVAAGQPPRPPIVVSSAFRLEPVTLPELGRAARKMNSSGAVGLDRVPLSAVKRCFSVIGPHLLKIVNMSLAKCLFPDAWKTAEVVPIYKGKGSVSQASNYRPISLLSHLSKLTEKMACDQLSRYLSANNILFHGQYAYRPCHCTEDAVLDAVDWISRNSERGEVSSITAADLSKAFDSVDHGVLLSKLGWYGIDSRWFESYLSGRGQVVRGGAATLPVRFGVPQGSLAGPILFSLFTNDLHCHLPGCRVIAYADDTQLLDHSLPDPQNLAHLKLRIENSLDSLQLWFRSNSLKMNPAKTDFCIIGTRQAIKNTEAFHITIAGTVTKPSASIRLLGVTIDPCMSWDVHIGQTVKKCNALLISLYRFRHHFTREMLKLIIETHVFPHILYCISVWGGTTKTQLARIQKLIKFSTRIVTGMRCRERVGPATASLGWKQVEQLVQERDLLKVHKAIHQQLGPPAIRNMFIRRSTVSSRTTRSSEAGDLELPRCRLSATQRGFRYRAAASWNHLPPAVTGRQTLSSFRASLRRVM